MSEPASEEMQDAAFQSDEDKDEDVDETVFGQDSDSSQHSDNNEDDAK
jgi:U3 small nucleolar RNA-associated protein 5